MPRLENDSELYTVDKATDTVRGQLDNYTDTSTPLMQRYAMQGRQEAAARGLTNSTIAVQGGMANVLDKAGEFATTDAAAYNNRKTETVKSQTHLDVVDKQSAAQRYDADTRFRGTQYDADARTQASRYDSDSRSASSRYDADSRSDASRYDADARTASARHDANTRADSSRYDADTRLEGSRYDADSRSASEAARNEAAQLRTETEAAQRDASNIRDNVTREQVEGNRLDFERSQFNAKAQNDIDAELQTAIGNIDQKASQGSQLEAKARAERAAQTRRDNLALIGAVI